MGFRRACSAKPLLMDSLAEVTSHIHTNMHMDEHKLPDTKRRPVLDFKASLHIFPADSAPCTCPASVSCICTPSAIVLDQGDGGGMVQGDAPLCEIVLGGAPAVPEARRPSERCARSPPHVLWPFVGGKQRCPANALNEGINKTPLNGTPGPASVGSWPS